MLNKKSTIVNISAALITFVVQLFISFWLSPFVVSKLGEEAYGFINLANNFVAYGSLITVMINAMASRFISIEFNSGRIKEAKEFYSTVFFANCFLFILITLAAIGIVYKLDAIINVSDILLNQVKLTFLFSFINMGISSLGTVFTSAAFTTNKMHYSSITQIISNVVKSILIFLLFTMLTPRIYWFSVATLIGSIAMLISNFVISTKLFKNFNVKLKYFKLNKLVRLLKSGFWVLISNVSNLLLNGLDLLLSNWFLNNAIMGRLSLAKQIPYAFNSALGMFSNIFSSSLTLSYANDGKESIISTTVSQNKILTFIFTVPYAGIIIFGKSFLCLWLNKANYGLNQINEIYILLLLVLLDIVISTYMYSIHSIFIALDKVKIYSYILLIASIVSSVLTVFLLQFTSLGVFAIAGTSTIILGFTHGIIVPALAANLLDSPIHTFWKSEFKSWALLLILVCLFKIFSLYLPTKDWNSFFLSIIVVGTIGYLISFTFLFSRSEIFNIIRMLKIKFKRI